MPFRYLEQYKGRKQYLTTLFSFDKTNILKERFILTNITCKLLLTITLSY